MTRVQLADEEWEFIGPYVPIGKYGPYPERLRQQFEGVIWRFKTGGQRREMPKEFGAWSTVHNCFRSPNSCGRTRMRCVVDANSTSCLEKFASVHAQDVDRGTSLQPASPGAE